MYVIDPIIYPIKPHHIDTSNPGVERSFDGAFGDEGRDRAAFVIVWMMQVGGWGFTPFTRLQFAEFRVDQKPHRGPIEQEYLELLISDGLIAEVGYDLRVTHEFVSRCFAAYPSGQYLTKESTAASD